MLEVKEFDCKIKLRNDVWRDLRKENDWTS